MKYILLLLICAVAIDAKILAKRYDDNITSFLLQENYAWFYQDDLYSLQKRATSKINIYMDKLFDNLHRYIVKNNMNSVNLPDANLKFQPSARIQLTKGHIEDMKTISRQDDVIVEYNSVEKKIIVIVPIQFGDLKFFYDYKLKVSFISAYGGVHGKVKNLKANAEMSFDFKKYSLSLDKYDMKHIGDISIRFTGDKVIDWLLNAMTKVVTVFMRPVIVDVIQKFIRNNLQKLIEHVNKLIAKINHVQVQCYLL